MQNIYLDTNILVDFLARRSSFFNPARQMMVFARMGDYRLWTGTLQLPTLVYVLSRGGAYSPEELRELLEDLHKVVHFCPLSEKQAEQALQSPWENLEDAFIHQAAIGIGADVLVTRNKKHFERSAIPVMDANEFFGWMYEKNSRGYGEITPEGVTVAGLD